MRILAGVLVLVLSACGDDGGDDDGAGSADAAPPGTPDAALPHPDGAPGPGGQPAPIDVFAADVTTIVIEVDYGSNAEPYTGNTPLIGDTWQLFETNISRIFQGKTLVSPSTLGEMQALVDVPAGGSFTGADILAIAAAHRDVEPRDGSTVSFYFVWLDGYFNDGSGDQTGVLGVSFGGTGVIAMFKPVIESTGSVVLPNIERYVEQSTAIHELGHAAGLVDNGVPMVGGDHRDDAHGAHCTSDSCVMYWLNEGASDAATFAGMYVTSGNAILFGPECLADVDAL